MLSDITWTCHVCGDERPDDKISVRSMPLDFPESRFIASQNVRYCNDREYCIENSKTKTFSPSLTPRHKLSCKYVADGKTCTCQ